MLSKGKILSTSPDYSVSDKIQIPEHNLRASSGLDYPCNCFGIKSIWTSLIFFTWQTCSPLHMNSFCSPMNSPVVAPCLHWRNKWEAKSANPETFPKGNRERKQLYYLVSVKPECDVYHRQSTRRWWRQKEIPHPFYSQVDAAHHIHVFKTDITNLQVERPDNIISYT